MTEDLGAVYDRVGPVLQAGSVANAIVAAIKDLNQDVLVVDRGAYVRVLVPQFLSRPGPQLKNTWGARFVSRASWRS